METTLTLAERYGVMPFAIFEQDTDEVIMVINHYLEKGATASNAPASRKGDDSQERIKVTSSTATGGWW